MGKCNIQAVPCERRAGHYPTPLKFGHLLFGSMFSRAHFPKCFSPLPMFPVFLSHNAVWEDRWAKPCLQRSCGQIGVLLQALGGCCLAAGGHFPPGVYSTLPEAGSRFRSGDRTQSCSSGQMYHAQVVLNSAQRSHMT